MRKKTISLLLTVLSFFIYEANAQLFFKPNASVQDAIKQVIADFPNRLQNITGSLVQENVESSDYTSKVNFTGTESCTITQYKSAKDKSRSWQAVFPETESFAEAKKQYHNLYLQVKNLNIPVPGNAASLKATGVYDAPEEQKKFAGTIFRFREEEGIYKNVKIEVSLHYIITGWQVSIYVYDKKEDDEIRPDTE
jgi:16S rRNA C967 or C1407 C5-methylase (RsmB/RsmF family)